MSLLSPLGLLGLLGIPVLVLLAFLRRRPRPVVWPSLLLWRAAAEGLPPRRRALDPLLLLECSAVLLLSLAAADPVVASGGGRKVVLLIDETAGAETLAELARLRSALDPRDEVVEFSAGADLATAAARLPEADLRVVATSLPGIEGPGLLVIGLPRPGHNVGIDAVRVSGDRLWFALATDGPAAKVAVRVGTATMEVPTGEGVETAFAGEIALTVPDNHSGDDRVTLERVALRARNLTGSREVAAALFRAGLPAVEADPPDLLVTAEGGEAAGETIRGADCVGAEGLYLEDLLWTGARTLPGEGLISWNGRAVVAWRDERTLWIGAPLDRPWDDHGTLAVLIERAKRDRARLLGGGRALVGDAWADPPPRFLDTRGVARPWDGRLPGKRAGSARGFPLRPILAGAGALLLLLLARAIVLRP